MYLSGEMRRIHRKREAIRCIYCAMLKIPSVTTGSKFGGNTGNDGYYVLP